MPKKKSHGGEQEYIPAGNGLASGTYASDSGDNEWHKEGKNTASAPLSHIKKPKPDKPKEQQNTSKQDLSEIKKPENNIQNNIIKSGYKLRDKQYAIDNMLWDESQYDDAEKIVKTYQTPKDKELEKLLDNGGTACFGKTMSEEQVQTIIDSVKQVKQDFPFVEIKYIGDRNKLEKLVNAERIVYDLDDNTLAKLSAKYKEMSKNSLEYKKNVYNWDDKQLDEYVEKQVKLRYENNTIYFSQSNRAIAYWDYSVDGIVYMPKGEKENIESIERQYKINFHPSNNQNVYITHELGHAIDTWIRREQNRIDYLLEQSGKDKTKLRNAKMIFNSYLQDFVQKNKESFIKTNKYAISEYADENPNEFVAECFSAYYGNMNNPLANEVVELFKQYRDKLKEIENE